MRDQLRSPASAQFSDESVFISSGIGDVSGKVDADNAFGASLRSVFSCDMENRGGEWTVAGGWVI